MRSYLRAVEKSQTLLLNEQSRNLESNGKEVFKFGFGQSPFPPMERAVQALQAHAAYKAYSPVQGLAELRERVAAFHKQADGIDIEAGNVLIAPGSKILLYTVMAAFTQADVLIPAPAWVSYRPQAVLLGHTPIAVETSLQNRWRITPHNLKEALARKKNADVPSVLILNYPGNPDGLSYSAEELNALALVLREHKVLVLSDEIYGLLHHEGAHRSLALDYPEGTIVTGGLSKWCGAGGWRLGVALLPKSLGGEFKDTLLGIASETYSCASLPIQYAACEAYKYDNVTLEYLAHQRRILALAGNWSAKRLQMSGVDVYSPEGGFYLFVDFTSLAKNLRRQGIETSTEMCAHMLEETGVALLPGDAFGMEPEHFSARLAYVEFNGAEALAASREVGLHNALSEQFLEQYLGKTVRGVERLCGWVKAFAAQGSNARLESVG